MNHRVQGAATPRSGRDHDCRSVAFMRSKSAFPPQLAVPQIPYILIVAPSARLRAGGSWRPCRSGLQRFRKQRVVVLVEGRRRHPLA